MDTRKAYKTKDNPGLVETRYSVRGGFSVRRMERRYERVINVGSETVQCEMDSGAKRA